MINTIKKILAIDQINQELLIEYVVKVGDVFNKPIKTPQEIQGVLMGFQMGQFNLMESIKFTCSKLDIPLRILSDKNGQVIKKYIQKTDENN